MLGNIQFANPAYLWGLLFLLPLGVWYFFNRKQQQARLSISSLAGFKGTTSLWVKLYPLLFVFRILALCLIIIAAARPQTVDVSTRTKTNKGIDIVMAIDVSSSMLAQDLKPNRLAALKNVAGDFINQRRSDRIGLSDLCRRKLYENPHHERQAHRPKCTRGNSLRRGDQRRDGHWDGAEPQRSTD